MSIEERAAALAAAHQPIGPLPARSIPLVDLRAQSAAIARAMRGFQTPRPEDPRFQKAAEWLLDNHYLIARTLRQTKKEIPAGFRRRLPYVIGDRFPRILRIAHALVESTNLDFDEATLLTFVAAYQAQAPLTIAELWALPAMLRVATLAPLVNALDVFFAPQRASLAASLLDPALGVERSVRTLRLLAEIDWKSFFQRTSAVESALRDDPSGIYVRMEFEARDGYRKVVERLAWDTERPEPEVARLAIDLAARRRGDAREGHVGYYLVDRGQEQLKRLVGYRPRGVERVRAVVLAHPTGTYLGGIGALSLLALGATVRLVGPVLGFGGSAVVCALLAVPLSSMAVAFVNRCVTLLLAPRLLPKLDFTEAVPAECRTAVVIPALVSTGEDFDRLFAQLELHYLSAPDPSLAFALLTDHVDSKQMPDDRGILAHAGDVVRQLNEKYAAAAVGPFHVLHRDAQWNEAEGCFMGWERKRGKLEEFNRRLRGDETTSFRHHVGDAAGLSNTRFVITLDADTQLPIGAARRLIGLAAHPLNSAVRDPRTGRTASGYTVVQPRVEAASIDGPASPFSKIWCGDTALDIYTHAVSDVYQDLFGSGAYVGKGIYEVDAFMNSVRGRVPENTLASHDLFEGIHGRSGLATDIVVLEQYPQNYLSFARRLHRWIRGDWQLLPWLLPLAPSSSKDRLPNQLSLVDRWKIVDNLRRSLFAPSLLALFFFGLSGRATAWACGALLVPLAIMAPALAGSRWRETLARWTLGLVFLPHEAWVATDAIVRAIVRMSITRKHLLQWVTSADTARAFAQGSRGVFWREMGPAAAVTTCFGVALGAWHPFVLPIAAPFVALWLLAPEIARWSSTPNVAKQPLTPADRRILRHLARRTWLFFETFVDPKDQWLAPDNFQQVPGGVVAHRTSPTNIGLMLVAELSAYDLGFIGRAELSALVQQSLATLARLERYRGHWLNWYDTRTLEPLSPRYVSTVDSGNLAAALITLAKGCRDAAGAPTVHPVRWQGLGDTLELLDEGLDRLTVSHTAASTAVATVRRTLERIKRRAGDASAAAQLLSSSEVPALEAALLEVLEQTSASPDVAAFREVRIWLDRFRHQLRSVHGDLEARILPDSLRDELLSVADRVDAARGGMEFTFLFEQTRKLFHIGYDVTSDRFDPNYYDLLASEARLASFLAVVQNQVPPDHWFTLGRPITRIRGEAALLSWGGTMFEYLMPSLFMRSQEHTLLRQSGRLAVVAQIEHGKKAGTPWGVSESGYAQLDAQSNYQYRSFGVPGLGLRRGLEEDRVIAPYACVLALPVSPRAVLDNLATLARLGAEGLYGLFEAVDYDGTRATEAARATGETVRHFAVVRSYMAHHQGMILAAINNALNDEVLVERFHSEAVVRTGARLLSERLPSVRIAEELARPTKEVGEPQRAPAFPGWIPERERPQVAILGNGHLTTMVTDTGAGFTCWDGLAVTRGSYDGTCDVDGTWIYVRDEVTGRVWSVAPAPTRVRTSTDEVVFHAHQVEFHHRDEGISLRTEIAVCAVDDVEVRNVTLHNETDEHRTLTLITYAEPVLESLAASARQPAFSRLFVECEPLPEQHGVLASRRKRSPDEAAAVVLQSVVWHDAAVTWIGSETNRRVFVGRRRDARAPQLTVRGAGYDEKSLSPLDPALVLAVRVKLAPGARVEVALVTAVAKTREAVLHLSRRFGSLHAVRWSVHDARRELARRLDREGMTPALLPHAMRLVSRLLFPGVGLRGSRAELSAAHPSKNSLWGHGISGDEPLLVVRVRSREKLALVGDILATFRFLRMCGQKAEIVFLDEASTGYQAEEPGSVRSFLIQAGAGAWLNKRSGIFVLAADQLSSDDRTRIAAAARVLLDSDNGSLPEQLAGAATPVPPLPHFAATRPVVNDVTLPPAPPTLVFENVHGGFTRDGREYVIKVDPARPTPAPWCNVLTNEEAGCLVSESGLGASWAGNSGENRLTPWRNDPVGDAPSEALYLRDEETAEVWTPTPLPAGLDVNTVVRHGAGYSSYERESHGLGQRLTVFVPPDAPVKILRLRLTNRLPRSRRLTATYYVEWVLGALRDEHQSHVVCELDASAQCLLARCGWNADFGDRVAFVSADRPPHGFTFDRAEFLGRSGSYARPAALGRWGLSGATEVGADPCAALQTHLELAPGESLDVHFVLGQGRDEAQAVALAQRFRAQAEVERAWLALHEHWDALLGAVQVKTPEPAMDLLLNRWLLYQTLSSRLLARTAFYQSSGAFGYRDQLQDVMAVVHGSPDLARAQILRAASHQFEEGDVLHWWHPPADRGVRTRCSDDMAWLPFVTAHYVEATGDASILNVSVPFLTAPPLRHDEHDRYAQFAPAPVEATVFEHCRRAMVRAKTEGCHGLPLIGDGDWNDGMNRVGVLGNGESVWLGFFLCATMNAFATLCERQGDLEEAERWRQSAAALGRRIDEVAWDGAWYLRAFYDDGSALGTARARTCRIDSIAQSWAVLSGAAQPARAAQALRSANEFLVRDSERLVVILDPPFEGSEPDPGYIKAYPSGVRENGGQYTHAATWLGFAHARIGDGAGAAEIFRLLNPILKTQAGEGAGRYRVEPYVLAGDVYGVPPFVGRGGWTWYTGAAAWMWRLGVEEILGLRRREGGLHVNPCVPPHWRGFEAWVRMGDENVHVVVDNSSGTGRGVVSMTLDGAVLEPPLVKLGPGSSKRELRVVLGVAAKAAE